jgi:hypothetical protein
MRGFLHRILQARTGLFAVILTAGSNVGIQGANLLAGILVARSLGPGGRGSLTAITMWPQFLAYSLTLGVPVASVYTMKMHPTHASSLSGAASALSILLGCVATLIGLVIIPFSLHT